MENLEKGNPEKDEKNEGDALLKPLSQKEIEEFRLLRIEQYNSPTDLPKETRERIKELTEREESSQKRSLSSEETKQLVELRKKQFNKKELTPEEQEKLIGLQSRE